MNLSNNFEVLKKNTVTSKKKIINIFISDVCYNQMYSKIYKAIKEENKIVINYANAHIIRIARKDEDLRTALQTADIVHSDGIGVWFASRLLKDSKLKYRFNFTDCAFQFLNDCRKNNWSLFILGATGKTLNAALTKIKKKFPGIDIAGALNGFRDLSDGNTVQIINKTKPDILWVGLGSPKQEIWIDKNKELLNCRIIQSVGDLITFIAGKKVRGPVIVQKLGLEWFARFLGHPIRYFNRYIIGIPVFSFMLFSVILKKNNNKF